MSSGKKKVLQIKNIYEVLLIAAGACILLQNFQSPEGTVRLSEWFRGEIEHFGIITDFHSVRSEAHLVMYFFFGIILTLFAREHGWKWWMILVAGFGFGLLDEGIKVLLPTREFEFIDLVKDWIGISAAVLLLKCLKRI